MKKYAFSLMQLKQMEMGDTSTFVFVDGTEITFEIIKKIEVDNR